MKNLLLQLLSVKFVQFLHILFPGILPNITDLMSCGRFDFQILLSTWGQVNVVLLR